MSETTTTKPASDAEHIANADKGARCPNCRSESIEYKSPNIEGRYAGQRASCIDCEATWGDAYHLMGYDNLEVDGVEIDHEDGTPQPLSLTARELAHVLAALRWCEQTGTIIDSDGNIPDTEHEALADAEIDALCERINGGETKPQPCLHGSRTPFQDCPVCGATSKELDFFPVCAHGEDKEERCVDCEAETASTTCPTCHKRQHPEGLTDEDKAALRQRAREEYANPSGDAIEIDDDAGFSLGGNGDGVWVQAWVWVQDES